MIPNWSLDRSCCYLLNEIFRVIIYFGRNEEITKLLMNQSKEIISNRVKDQFYEKLKEFPYLAFEILCKS